MELEHIYQVIHVQTVQQDIIVQQEHQVVQRVQQVNIVAQVHLHVQHVQQDIIVQVLQTE